MPTSKNSKPLLTSFPPSARILKAREYDLVKQEGSRGYGQWLLISYMSRKAGNTSRLGIAVTKKIAPRAVDRNKFKRTLRDAFRLIRSKIAKPTDIVVVARRDVAGAPSAKLKAEFYSILQQEQILSL